MLRYLFNLHRSAAMLLGLMLLISTGCDRLSKGAEDRDPNIKRARERRAVGDYEGALENYQKALARKPDWARVHWEMASVYDQNLTNDLRAIYHYQRYLELEPKADRRKLVEDLVGAARMSYAASLPARPSEAVQEIARLNREIDELKNKLAFANDELNRLKGAATSARTSGAQTTPGSAPAPDAESAAPVEVYVVRSGDTLSRIAGHVYGDQDKWHVIYDANRSVLPKPESVKVGQTLVIPR